MNLVMKVIIFFLPDTTVNSPAPVPTLTKLETFPFPPLTFIVNHTFIPTALDRNTAPMPLQQQASPAKRRGEQVSGYAFKNDGTDTNIMIGIDQ
jgi:hypothetical protein